MAIFPLMNITVQTFNSCTSRLDVCYCLVVQTPMDNMLKNKPNTSMTHAVFESKQRPVVRSSMLRDLVAIGRAVLYYAQLPTYLVQELNVGTFLSPLPYIHSWYGHLCLWQILFLKESISFQIFTWCFHHNDLTSIFSSSLCTSFMEFPSLSLMNFASGSNLGFRRS